MDDEFNPEVDLDQLGKHVSDEDLSDDDVSGDEEDDANAQVRPGISLAHPERISIACGTQLQLFMQEEDDSSGEDNGITRKAQVPQLTRCCTCACSQALQFLRCNPSSCSGNLTAAGGCRRSSSMVPAAMSSMQHLKERAQIPVRQAAMRLRRRAMMRRQRHSSARPANTRQQMPACASLQMLRQRTCYRQTLTRCPVPSPTCSTPFRTAPAHPLSLPIAPPSWCCTIQLQPNARCVPLVALDAA